MTEAAFFDALRDDPTDDLTRLVYADWLDDHGNCERAEFIRLAVHLDSLPENHPERAELQARYTYIHLSNRAAWLGKLPQSVEDVSFRGGLPVWFKFQSCAPTSDIETLLSRHPVGEISVCGERTVRELERSPALNMVRSLSVREGLQRRQARLMDRLIESTQLTRLRELTMTGDVIDNYLARVIADSFTTRSLRSLRLERTSLDDSGINHLLRREALPELEDWYVECGRANGFALKPLFHPERSRRWRSLYWPRLRSCVREELVGIGTCAGLRKLHIVLPPMGVPGSKLKAWFNRMPELAELHLTGPLFPADAKDLAFWPGLSRLKRLNLETGLALETQREEMREELLASPHYNEAMKLEMTG